MSGEDTQHKPKTNGVVKMIGIGMVILILSSGLYYFLSYNDEIDDELIVPTERTLGQRLDDAGWMLYVDGKCSACKTQMELVGWDMYGLKIHDCDASLEDNIICHEEGIQLIPTWRNVFSNETRVGIQSIEKLEEMATHR